jgi:hypothetical protein
MAMPITYIESLRVGEIFANYDSAHRDLEPFITLLSAINDWKSKGLDEGSATDIIRGYASHAKKIHHVEAAVKAYAHLGMKKEKNEVKKIPEKTEHEIKLLRDELMHVIEERKNRVPAVF